MVGRANAVSYIEPNPAEVRDIGFCPSMCLELLIRFVTSQQIARNIAGRHGVGTGGGNKDVSMVLADTPFTGERVGSGGRAAGDPAAIRQNVANGLAQRVQACQGIGACPESVAKSADCTVGASERGFAQEDCRWRRAAQPPDDSRSVFHLGATMRNNFKIITRPLHPPLSEMLAVTVNNGMAYFLSVHLHMPVDDLLPIVALWKQLQAKYQPGKPVWVAHVREMADDEQHQI